MPGVRRKTYRYTDLLREFGSARDRIAALGIKRAASSHCGPTTRCDPWPLFALLAAGRQSRCCRAIATAEALLADCQATACWTSIRGPLELDDPGASLGEHPLLVAIEAAGDAGIVLFTSGSTGRPRRRCRACLGSSASSAAPARACARWRSCFSTTSRASIRCSIRCRMAAPSSSPGPFAVRRLPLDRGRKGRGAFGVTDVPALALPGRRTASATCRA